MIVADVASTACVAIYIILSTFWFAVVVATFTIFFIAPERTVPDRYPEVQTGLLLVALALFVDSTFWAVVNLSAKNILHGDIAYYIRQDWVVFSVKLLVFVSGAFFFVLMLKVSRVLAGAFDRRIFRNFINYTVDAIGVLDEDGRVILWNRGATELFGFREEDVFKKHITAFLVPEQLHEEIKDTLESVKKKRTASSLQTTRRKTLNGDEIAVDVTISPIVHDEVFYGYFGIMRRSTDRNEAASGLGSEGSGAPERRPATPDIPTIAKHSGME